MITGLGRSTGWRSLQLQSHLCQCSTITLAGKEANNGAFEQYKNMLFTMYKVPLNLHLQWVGPVSLSQGPHHLQRHKSSFWVRLPGERYMDISTPFVLSSGSQYLQHTLLGWKSIRKIQSSYKKKDKLNWFKHRLFWYIIHYLVKNVSVISQASQMSVVALHSSRPTRVMIVPPCTTENGWHRIIVGISLSGRK